jgi:hypothetical protein
MRELKAIREEAFPGQLICCVSDVNIILKWARTILSDDINRYSLFFLCGFMCRQFGNWIVTLYMLAFIWSD